MCSPPWIPNEPPTVVERRGGTVEAPDFADEGKTLNVDVLGTAVALRAPEPILTELRAVLIDLEPGLDPSRHLVLEEDADGRFRLLDARALIREGIAPSVAAATVVWRLNAIAAETSHHLVIHAGCVTGERAVLLPGQSGAGKSRLVAGCVTAGLSYLSDEYAVVELEGGSIVPYAKPIGLDGERLVAASHVRPGSVGSSSPPGGIVFPRYEPHAPTTATALDPGRTLIALAAHATNLATVGGAAVPWLAGIAASCPAWQITYGDARDAVAQICEMARAPARVPQPADVIGPITPTTTTVTLGDDVAVFDDLTGKIHLLNPGAAFVWMCVPDASDGSHIADVAFARAPVGSLDQQDIAATVEHLVGTGLLPHASR